MHINHVAACFRLASQSIPNNKKKEKGCLMVMANPLDLGHGKIILIKTFELEAHFTLGLNGFFGLL